MLVSVREHAAGSVDRYIVFTDCLRWRSVPDWVELVLLDCEVSADRDANWAIKPLLLSHPSVAQDLLLYIDADTTVYSDVIGRCFQWIQDRSLLVYMDFLEPDQNWGPINLLSVYQQAGYDARNLKINAGIIGRAPDALGRAMQRLYGKLFAEGGLRRFFADEMYRRNDEPYLGLAVQLAYRELGIPQAETLHDLSVQDYALTIGANPAPRDGALDLQYSVLSVPPDSLDVLMACRVVPAVVGGSGPRRGLYPQKTFENEISGFYGEARVIFGGTLFGLLVRDVVESHAEQCRRYQRWENRRGFLISPESFTSGTPRDDNATRRVCI